LSAGTPGEAIRTAEEHGGEIHLLVTDVIMPGMNGRELAGRVRQIRPGIQCLYMSGYTADVIARQGMIEEGVQFIQKPFSGKEIAAKIRAVLGGG
jgi:YesN/AraC family two-component response regulator